uniref:Maturin n=1 Tax=Dromaius novaehollandiae TaxID=8790 RepID=A0A8C4P679_DRONO
LLQVPLEMRESEWCDSAPTLRECLLMSFLSFVAVGFQHVWSESEDCLPFLQLAQDYISSCGKKTLHEILEKVFKSFRPLLGLPDVDDDAFEEYNADVEEEEPEADHQQMGVSQQ